MKPSDRWRLCFLPGILACFTAGFFVRIGVYDVAAILALMSPGAFMEFAAISQVASLERNDEWDKFIAKGG